MELLFTLILAVMKLVPAIIFTVIAFLINPILGVLCGILFLSAAVVGIVIGLYREGFFEWISRTK
ncbi:MAG: hypothetical protein J6S28_02040 [Clostridia bacterium]|nr:hypothetical protein [Clostridia bacterium]MBO5842284.1 hypothetical protein [Clostridia bacterium]